MKTGFLLALVLGIVYFSCNEEIDFNGDRYELATNSEWVTEDFKTDYVIQFPAGYTGNGMMIFEGNFFFKAKADSSIIVSYAYCGPLFCEDFGSTYFDFIPEKLNLEDRDYKLETKVYFFNNGSLFSLLYYNLNEGVGKLFIKVADRYYEAADITFSEAEIEEAIEILRTVQKK